jgi:hypothetical protein
MGDLIGPIVENLIAGSSSPGASSSAGIVSASALVAAISRHTTSIRS